MEMSLFIDYHGISKIAKIRITLIVCIQVSQVYHDSNDSNDKMIAMIICQLLANCRTTIVIATALLTSTLPTNYYIIKCIEVHAYIEIKSLANC